MSAAQGTWRVIVCDRFGQAISNISAIAFGKQYVGTLNRPAAFSFWCPANDARVAGLNVNGSLDNAGDNMPMLDETRTVRAYRRELQDDGSYDWVLRFAGHVWIIEDEGDGEKVRTHVTCFDPLIMLNKRIARRMVYMYYLVASGVTPFFYPFRYPADPYTYRFPLYDDGAFSNPSAGSGQGAAIVKVSGPEVARGLLNCTNWYDGFTGLDDFYVNQYFNKGYRYPDGAVSWTADTSPPVSTTVSPTYDNKPVGDAITDLCDMYNGFDIEVVPTDSYYSVQPFIGGGAPEYTGLNPKITKTGPGSQSLQIIGPGSVTLPILGTSGRAHGSVTPLYQTLALLKYHVSMRGSVLDNLVFGYGAPPHNVKTISRLRSKEDLVNFSRALGSKGKVGSSLNLTSVDYWGYTFMGAPTNVDLPKQSLLDSVAAESTRLGGVSMPKITILPKSGGPLPWDDFNLGDTARVEAGDKLRGGFSAWQRIYGFTLDIGDDHTTETVSAIVTSDQV